MSKTADIFTTHLKKASIRLIASAVTGQARIRVYNAVGRLVATLKEVKPAKAHVDKPTDPLLAPGLYFYDLAQHSGSGRLNTNSPRKFVVTP